MGLQSFVFYAGLAWLPAILRDSGYSASAAGTLLAKDGPEGLSVSRLREELAARQGSTTR